MSEKPQGNICRNLILMGKNLSEALAEEIVGSNPTVLWFDCDLLDDEKIYYENARD